MNKRGRPREFDYSSIVDVAMKTFWLRGYEGCSTQDLCSDTGLGKEVYTILSVVNMNCINKY